MITYFIRELSLLVQREWSGYIISEQLSACFIFLKSQKQYL